MALFIGTARAARLDETDLTGVTTNSAFKEYIFFVGRRIARRDSRNAVNYSFADHLGSTPSRYQFDGRCMLPSGFTPYGGELTPAGFSNTAVPITDSPATNTIRPLQALLCSRPLLQTKHVSLPDRRPSRRERWKLSSWNKYGYDVGNDPLN